VSLFYRMAYLVGFKPWDSGVTPPELVAVVEGANALPAGKALDLGCGTGTNAIYLAQHSWEVTAIDLTPRAVAAARRKAAAAGARPRILAGDVTRLETLRIGDGFTLLFDLGCYHSIPDVGRDAYARGVTAAAAPGARLLMFGFAPHQMRFGPTGFTRDELECRFPQWTIESAVRGSDRMETWWFRLRRL
jgi:SAM-dependent methyltransferase